MSTTYTEGCEHLLAQNEANEAEAKHKVEGREAIKEIRHKEKEDYDLHERE